MSETDTETAPAVPAERRPAPGDAVHYYTTDPNEQRVSIGSGPYKATVYICDSEQEFLDVVPPFGTSYRMTVRHKDKAGRDGRWWEWPSA